MYEISGLFAELCLKGLVSTRLQRFLPVAGLAVIVLCAAVSWRWPLPADSAIMHYIGFVIRRGGAPYRAVIDMNFPACYLPDMLLGVDPRRAALLWRFFDFGLVCTVLFAYCKIARAERVAAAVWPAVWLAVWAAALFALVHVRDGVEQAGERDLTAGVLLLLAVVFLLSGMHSRARARFFAFGLMVGFATLFKPTLVVFYLLVFVPTHDEDGSTPTARLRVTAGAGVIAPMLLAAALLGWTRSWTDFWYVVRAVSPYHASLGRLRLPELLYRAVSPVVPLGILWVLTLVLSAWGDREERREGLLSRYPRRVLTVFALLGLLSFLLQGKGYPYQRYPFLIALLPLFASEFCAAVLRRRPVCGVLALAALVWSFAIFAPSSIYKARRFQSTSAEFIGSLTRDLTDLSSGSLRSLDGEVQCLDSVSGCIATLYQMQIRQSTGELYDEFLFNRASGSVVQTERDRLLRALEREPPKMIVVSGTLFPSGPDGYGKLTTWPALDAWLRARYRLAVERAMRPVQSVGRVVVPAGYRVYVLQRSSKLPVGAE